MYSNIVFLKKVLIKEPKNVSIQNFSKFIFYFDHSSYLLFLMLVGIKPNRYSLKFENILVKHLLNQTEQSSLFLLIICKNSTFYYMPNIRSTRQSCLLTISILFKLFNRLKSEHTNSSLFPHEGTKRTHKSFGNEAFRTAE